MRDPARIPALCDLLRRAWERSPDLRLGQLVVNAVRPSEPCPQVFYAEDGRVRRGLESMARDGVDEPELPSHRDAEVQWESIGSSPQTTVTLDGSRLGTFEVGMFLCEVLELRFGGEYRRGSAGNPDASAMVLQVVTELTRSEPDVVLLDLSALRYTWGNSLLRVFEAIRRFDTEYPVGAVVLGGPDSAPALASLGLMVHSDASEAFEDAKTQALRRSVDIG